MTTITSQDLVSVVSNLTGEECNSLQSTLMANNIPFMVNGHGPESQHQNYYFEIKVERKNLEKVRPIVARHKAATFLNSQKCPRCGHLGHRKRKKDTWRLKIYFWGTMLLECKNCKRLFGG
jgi:hypothetical protein